MDLLHVRLSLPLAFQSNSPYSNGTARVTAYAASSNAQTFDFQVSAVNINENELSMGDKPGR